MFSIPCPFTWDVISFFLDNCATQVANVLLLRCKTVNCCYLSSNSTAPSWDHHVSTDAVKAAGSQEYQGNSSSEFWHVSHPWVGDRAPASCSRWHKIVSQCVLSSFRVLVDWNWDNKVCCSGDNNCGNKSTRVGIFVSYYNANKKKNLGTRYLWN